MTDFYYTLASIGFFALMILFMWACEKSNPNHTPATMENLLIGIISVGLIIYLIFSIIRPEKF